MNKLAQTMLISFLLLTLPMLGQTAENICEAEGYTVGFFNGVNTTYSGAYDSLKRIEADVIGDDEFGGESVQFEIFYNQTSGLLEDLAEVFSQRQSHLNNLLENRWFLFWGALTELLSLGHPSDTEDDYIAAAAHYSESASALMSTIETAALNSFADRLLALAENSDLSGFDVARHESRIKTLVLEKRKLMLIAHSQGNLFVNHAHDVAVQVAGSSSVVETLHVAPPTTSLRGNYFLSDRDLVVNGLRAFGTISVPPNNLTYPASHLATDPTGHGMIASYLNPLRSGLNAIKGSVINSMDTLMPAESNANAGFFTVTMTWNSMGDVDLHTYEPNGGHVFYQSKVGSSGVLDVDNTAGFGPEHYYASCDRSQLQVGTYQVGINHYSGASGAVANVQVSSAKDGVLYSTSLPVGPARGTGGNSSPIPVVNVEVAEDDEGALSVSVN